VADELRLAPQGNSLLAWRWNVPRIEDQLLDCVVYLYASEADAKTGYASGGSGFLVAIPSEAHKDIVYVYAVTNSHVIREGGSTVIRFNTQQGDNAIAPLTDAHWVHHPDGDDIAVAAIAGLDQNVLKFCCVHIKMFATREIIAQLDIGPGDDVFMVGRFVAHDGKQRNLPSVRFGNISMMPDEHVQHPRGYKVESFLVETRSLGGYSGSPVFVHILSASRRPKDTALLTPGRPTGPWLLGVDWGHLPIYEKVKEKDRVTNVSEGFVVSSNSGQMAVVPAWKLHELLYEERFVMLRKKSDDDIAKDKASNPVVLDVQIRETDKTFDKKAFEDSLKRASRKTSEPES
jgi:hypothetical protein